MVGLKLYRFILENDTPVHFSSTPTLLSHYHPLKQKPGNLNRFSTVLDEKLREINSDYDAKRYQNIALVAPKVHIAPEGTFVAWLRKKGKLGGQNKVPRLSNTREYLEEIMQVNGM